VSIGIAAVVSLWLVAPAAWASDDGAPPAVTQSGNAFTVDLPGVGSLVFTVDPATGAISNVVVTPAATGGFTVGTPTVSDEGVEVSFTGAGGNSQVLAVQVDHQDGTVTVKPESDKDDSEANDKDDHQANDNDQADQNDEHAQAPSSAGATTSTTEPDEHAGEQGEAQGDQKQPTAEPTTTTAVSQSDHGDHEGAGNHSETGGSHGAGGENGGGSGGSGGD